MKKVDKKAQQNTNISQDRREQERFESYKEMGKNGHYPLFFDDQDKFSIDCIEERKAPNNFIEEQSHIIFQELLSLETFEAQRKLLELLPLEQKKSLATTLLRAVEDEMMDAGPTLH